MAKPRFHDPPSLLLICVFIMFILWLVWPVASIFTFPLSVLGIFILLAGTAVSIIGSVQFKKAGTTIKPSGKISKLVTDGVFRFSRNPMYLGFSLFLVGLWIILGAASPVIGIIIFVFVTDRWYIEYEENMLMQKFGREYKKYKAKTRRWI